MLYDTENIVFRVILLFLGFYCQLWWTRSQLEAKATVKVTAYNRVSSFFGEGLRIVTAKKRGNPNAQEARHWREALSCALLENLTLRKTFPNWGAMSYSGESFNFKVAMTLLFLWAEQAHHIFILVRLVWWNWWPHTNLLLRSTANIPGGNWRVDAVLQTKEARKMQTCLSFWQCFS